MRGRRNRKHICEREANSGQLPGQVPTKRKSIWVVERPCAQSCRSLAAVRRTGLSRTGATDHMADTMCSMNVDHCIREVGGLDRTGLNRLARTLGYLGVSAVFADPA